MPLPYIRPGVTVTELVSPAVSTVLLDPNVLAIVGPARGFENHVEVVLLNDNTPVTLKAFNADPSTIVVRDASNLTLAPFTESTNQEDFDFTVNDDNLFIDGTVTVARAMQTAIDDGEVVAVYYSNAASPASADDVETQQTTLTRLVQSRLEEAENTLELDSIVVMSVGKVPSGDFTVTNAGVSGTAIKLSNSPSYLQEFQTVYLDYDIADTEDSDALNIPLTFNGTTNVSLPDGAQNIVVKTGMTPNSNPATVVLYVEGTTLDEDEDYLIEGTGITATIRRSKGTTTIGGLNDRLVVRITYQATPTNYWEATRCLSQADVEDKFGPPFDSQGAVVNPLSVATLLAFQNGATTVIAQPLFQQDPDTGARSAPTGSLNDWDRSLQSLYGIKDITLITPVISAGQHLSVTPTDGLNLEILDAVQSFVQYMRVNQTRFVIAICGEDSTGGTMASNETLQAHASDFGDGPFPEQFVLISESGFTFANPVTGATGLIGGQYAAAALAGMLARYPVQTPLTGKRIAGLNSLLLNKTDIAKDADAQTGLMVIESRKGTIQPRHSITTSQESRAHQELSVIRARNWMLANLVDAFEEQVIGRMVINQETAFALQVLLHSELNLLIQQGAIISYDNVQMRQDPIDPTAVQVRFTYKPVFPLNHVNIIFSIDPTSGVSFDTSGESNQSTSTQGF